MTIDYRSQHPISGAVTTAADERTMAARWTAEADQTLKWIRCKEEQTLSDYIDAIGADGGKATVSELARTDGADSTIKTRGARYGRFADNSKVAQGLKAVVRSGLSKRKISGLALVGEEAAVELKPFQLEAIDMILHKIGRIVCGDPNYVDSWHDIAGYALLVEKILNGENP